MKYKLLENIVAITGAGISVESGIQPFRGKNVLLEENPMEMATYAKFSTEPSHFLHRACRVDFLSKNILEILRKYYLRLCLEYVY